MKVFVELQQQLARRVVEGVAVGGRGAVGMIKKARFFFSAHLGYISPRGRKATYAGKSTQKCWLGRGLLISRRVWAV